LKPGSIVEARVSSTTVEFRHHGGRITSHERCYSRLQKIFDLEHYLDVCGPEARSVAWFDAAGAVASPGPVA